MMVGQGKREGVTALSLYHFFGGGVPDRVLSTPRQKTLLQLLSVDIGKVILYNRADCASN